MQNAYRAQVMTIEKDGPEKIIGFVAKIWFGDDFPDASNHTINAWNQELCKIQ
jgi:hypothetical protein